MLKLLEKTFLMSGILLLPCTCSGQGVSNIPGVFSETGFGARPIGMAQAYTAVSDDAHAFLTNPAGMLLGTRPSFTANYARLFGIIPSGYFGLLYPLSTMYSVGAGFLFTGDDALMENTIGISFAFTAPNIPIGRNEIYLDKMSFGITVKGRWTSFGNNPDGGANRITGSGSGFGIDLGYLFLLNEHISLGIMIRDLVNSFQWESSVSGKYSENVPTTLRFGSAYRFNGLTVAFDLRKNLHDDTANRAYFGAEKILFEMVALRAGFSNNLGSSDLNRKWSFGLGLIRSFFESYAVAINTAYRVDDIDNQFRFGMDISWGIPKKMPRSDRFY